MESFDITADQTNDNETKYINCIPKIHITQYVNLSLNHNILLVPFDMIQYISPLLTDLNTLNHTYHLFHVNINNLKTLLSEIIHTTGKYVYPMVFVNYLKHSLSIREKMNFNNELLLRLRVWSNQIRELAQRQNLTEYTYTPDLITNSDTITYIGYHICCALMYYYKYEHYTSNR